MFPTEIRFKTNTLLKVMLSPPGAFFLGGVTVLIFRNWPSDNAAAWVQAVGSIGAILGAFMIATHAHKLERRAARDSELSTNSRAVLLAEGIVQEAAAVLSSICERFHKADDTPATFRRMESVHQALMLAVSQPISESALKPVLKTLQRVSDSCGILQDAMSHKGVLRGEDMNKLRSNFSAVKANSEALGEVLQGIRARRKIAQA
jgi:hypothetical protein